MIGRLDQVARLEDLVGLRAEGVGIVAGGTDYVPMYRAGLVSHERVVDVTRVPELAAHAVDADAARLGAATRLRSATHLAEPCWAALADGAAMVGSVQTRNRATLGGNLCRASPSGDTLPPLLACRADLVVTSARGSRTVPVDHFFAGPGQTIMLDDEIVTTIVVPRRPAVSAYLRATTRRAMDLAIVGVAVALDVDGDAVVGGRLALGGVGPRPLVVPDVNDLVTGRRPDELTSLVGQLDDRAQSVVSPIDDVRGSAWYRRRMVTTLIDRAIRAATRRI
jgi:carbon-monoxide dehydrogenase medium subunit